MLEAYKLSRKMSYSNPIKEMRREKQLQIESLYNLAADREDGVLKNGIPFIQTPRIYGFKKKDDVHSLITVEVVNKDDWFEVGDYIEYDGGHWLCMNASNFHGMYCVGTFQLCNWKLYWMDKNKNIKSAYCIDYNSTQYNSGESSNKLITLGSAQHMLYMQCNEDTVLLDTPIRICLDRNHIDPTFYKITQNDTTTYNYGKGLCCVTVTETQDNKELNKKILLDNGEQIWISNYFTSSFDKPVISTGHADLIATLNGNSELKTGYSRTYTVLFNDRNGQEVTNVDFEWHVSNPNIQTLIDGKSIKISVDNEDYIGSSFLLQVIIDGLSIIEKQIKIIEGY